MASSHNFFGVMKYKLDNGNYVVGYGFTLSDKYFLQVPNETIDGFYYIEVLPISSARQITLLPNNFALFEYDVFESPNGELFYITFDYTRLAIVYLPVYDNINLLKDINIFECKYRGNLIFDEF